MRKHALVSLVVVLAILAGAAPNFARAEDDSAKNDEQKFETTYPGVVGDWFGFESHDFKFQGRDAKIVFPKERAEGNPWIWRARFFGHEPQFDRAMLERGYVLVYVDSAPLMGSPKSVALWQDFYRYVTKTFGLGKKANLEGMSRGGLYTTNWAFAYPDEVATIYIDNPVLDFRSWPGGFGKGKRSDKDWEDVKKYYELNEEEARAYDKNPAQNVEGCKALVENGVGILLVCGDSDTVVPGEENRVPFQKLYESLGGDVELILKKGNDHHPHSLPDPTPIVDFVVKRNSPSKAEEK